MFFGAKLPYVAVAFGSSFLHNRLYFGEKIRKSVKKVHILTQNGRQSHLEKYIIYMRKESNRNHG